MAYYIEHGVPFKITLSILTTMGQSWPSLYGNIGGENNPRRGKLFARFSRGQLQGVFEAGCRSCRTTNPLSYGEHIFKLEPLDTDKTRLLHNERFAGLALPFASLDAVEEGYNLMNHALKEHVEAIAGRELMKPEP